MPQHPRIISEARAANLYRVGITDLVPPVLPPTVATAPVATGTGALGSTLSCTAGMWNNTPDTYAYQWLRGGATIAGATVNTHVVAAADISTTVSCQVTATNSAGSANSTSNGIPCTP
jgi:hypothetical protein